MARPKKKLKALHWEKVDTPLTTHWAAHAPTPAEKEEKYAELTRKGVLDEVEKLFMAKEIKKIGKTSGNKTAKKQIISSDLARTFRKYYFCCWGEVMWMDDANTFVCRNLSLQVLGVLG